ncbi:MAG: hypothetical protein CR972_02740 [Candidatus Moraniibacteriota bacterium]|nr:MAG: hypothetical protein CR972_02740 [Candidatus Moranbacteria bacterium]
MLFLSMPLFTFAQEAGGVEIISNVNVPFAYLLEQKDHDVYIMFTISNNGENTQSDIRYSVKLLERTEESEVLVDEKVYEEVLTLAPGESVEKEITYTIPKTLSGTYDLDILVATSKGLDLAPLTLDTVTVESEVQGVELRDCTLRVDEEFFGLRNGVDISTEEDLYLECALINHAGEKQTLTPEFTTRQQTTFGKDIEKTKKEHITLQPNETREISFLLPTPKKPQAYDTLVELKSNDEVLSNTVVAHYVIQGESGTIKSIQLDETSYKKNDKALVSLFLTQRADSFPDARKQFTQEQTMIYDVYVYNNKNELCGKKENNKTQSDVVTEKVAVNITKDCIGPYATVELHSEDGTLLDTTEKNATAQTTQKTQKQQKDEKTLPLSLIITLLITIILIIGIFIFSKKNNSKNITVFLFFLFGGMMMYHNSHAITITSGNCFESRKQSLIMSANVKQEQNNKVTVSGSAYFTFCYNYHPSMQYKLNLNKECRERRVECAKEGYSAWWSKGRVSTSKNKRSFICFNRCRIGNGSCPHGEPILNSKKWAYDAAYRACMRRDGLDCEYATRSTMTPSRECRWIDVEYGDRTRKRLVCRHEEPIIRTKSVYMDCEKDTLDLYGMSTSNFYVGYFYKDNIAKLAGCSVQPGTFTNVTTSGCTTGKEHVTVKLYDTTFDNQGNYQLKCGSQDLKELGKITKESDGYIGECTFNSAGKKTIILTRKVSGSTPQKRWVTQVDIAECVECTGNIPQGAQKCAGHGYAVDPHKSQTWTQGSAECGGQCNYYYIQPKCGSCNYLPVTQEDWHGCTFCDTGELSGSQPQFLDGWTCTNGNKTQNCSTTTYCTERTCSPNGKCMAKTKVATDPSECSNTCTSDANCSGSKFREVRP